MAVNVISPGLSTTVQDLGRPGYYHLGIPLSGGMDRFALRAANMLVGNDEGAAVLEAVFLGPELEFTAPATVAVTVMVRVSRFFTWASSWAITPRISARVSMSSRPVVAQTAAWVGLRPVAKALGWSLGTMAMTGRGSPASCAICTTSAT